MVTSLVQQMCFQSAEGTQRERSDLLPVSVSEILLTPAGLFLVVYSLVSLVFVLCKNHAPIHSRFRRCGTNHAALHDLSIRNHAGTHAFVCLNSGYKSSSLVCSWSLSSKRSEISSDSFSFCLRDLTSANEIGGSSAVAQSGISTML